MSWEKEQFAFYSLFLMGLKYHYLAVAYILKKLLAAVWEMFSLVLELEQILERLKSTSNRRKS